MTICRHPVSKVMPIIIIRVIFQHTPREYARKWRQGQPSPQPDWQIIVHVMRRLWVRLPPAAQSLLSTSISLFFFSFVKTMKLIASLNFIRNYLFQLKQRAAQFSCSFYSAPFPVGFASVLEKKKKKKSHTPIWVVSIIVYDPVQKRVHHNVNPHYRIIGLWHGAYGSFGQGIYGLKIFTYNIRRELQR